MPFDVQLTAGAVLDLEDIHDDIGERHSFAEADYVLERIKRASSGLAEHPHRGSYPKELLDLGIRNYREVFFKPYRIIYRVVESSVYVLLIADGRRDMQSLLRRRMLGA